MNFLKTASFGGLFTVTFTVAAAFQIAFTVLGLAMAFLSPGLFQMNGVAATNPGQAIGTLLFLLVFALAMNAAISALGALIWLGVRRLIPGKTAPQPDAAR